MSLVTHWSDESEVMIYDPKQKRTRFFIIRDRHVREKIGGGYTHPCPAWEIEEVEPINEIGSHIVRYVGKCPNTYHAYLEARETVDMYVETGEWKKPLTEEETDREYGYGWHD